jgi:hypothetical protein
MRVPSHLALAVAIAAALTIGARAAGQAPSSAAVCSLFSAADAQRIMGGPMKPKPNAGATVCMYALTEGYGTVALTVVRSADRAAEDRAWASIKEVRHLQVGQKNTKQLIGVGDEAWMSGNVEKGKLGVSGIIARKGNAHFAIDVMTLDYRASPDALTEVAKAIAQKL